MDKSVRFWMLILGVLLMDSIFVAPKKTDVAKREILQRSKRMTVADRKAVDFATSFATQASLMAIGSSNPFVGLTAGFGIGILITAIWPTDTYTPIRARVIQDIQNEMNHQSVERMKMKLRDYGSQIKRLFSILHIPGREIQQWKRSVASKGLGVYNQKTQLQNLNNSVGGGDFKHFKAKIIALTTDIGNDRHNFYIPSDPASSLAYYREFATIQIDLLASELLILASDKSYSKSLITRKRNDLKSITASHYKFVLWAVHKSAAKVEDKTRDWRKYNEAVNMTVNQYPLEEWKKLSSFNDDSKYIRNEDIVSLKFPSQQRKWMSCSGPGSKCSLRDCPRVDNPWGEGKEYQYGFDMKCRGEIFWIHGNLRHSDYYVRVCDKVALRYIHWSDRKAGYWLSLDEGWFPRKFYNTRTCPGLNFDNSRLVRCRMEQFELFVEEKTCGDKLEDRDVVKLRDMHGGYVGFNDRCNSKLGVFIWYSYSVPRHYYCFLKPKPEKSAKWRIFKKDSFIRNDGYN